MIASCAAPATSAHTGASELADAFSSVAARVTPSVVRVGVARRRGSRLRWSSGSGVIVRADGYVLTNYHVVKDGVRFRVGLHDGRGLGARLVGSDAASDLALLAVGARDLSAAELARASDVRVGDWAIAIGAPFGLEESVSAGVVSAVGRWGLGEQPIEDFVQTDATIHPGSSGGPLVDLEGRVIGINTMTFGDAASVGLAVSSDVARVVVDQLVASGEVRWPWIGVTLKRTYDARAHGPRLVVTRVAPGSPAASVLAPGDVVVRVDGEPLARERALIRRVLLAPIGARYELEVERRGARRSVSLRSEHRPLAPAMAAGGEPEPWC